MNEFSEALALGKLVAEKTGITLEEALSLLASVETKVSTGKLVKVDSLRRINKNLPDNIINFVATVPSGKRMSTKEIYSHCGLQPVKQEKQLSYYLKQQGWTAEGKEKGRSIYKKN